MIRTRFLLVALTLLLSVTNCTDRVCESGKVYVKLIKKSKSFAEDESYMVKMNDIVVLESPVFEDDKTHIKEDCIPSSTNNQYSVMMIDTYKDSWFAGSWLEIRGVYGNVVFKNYLVDKSSETYGLSLYMPIMKTSTWKMTSGTVTGTWKTLDYTAAGWTEVTTGSVTAQSTGTQYFRKTFAGITGMAAYEVQFNYRYGIVAYVNGIEIYRDNMDQGVVESNTPATGSYTTVGYKGVIRPSTEVPAASVLAVELHYLVVTSANVVDFDAYVAEYAPSIKDTACYIVGTEVTVSSPNDSGTRAFDFNKESFFQTTANDYILYSYTQTVIPYVNGFRLWPYTNVANTAKSLLIEGANEYNMTNIYHAVMSAGDMLYTAFTDKFLYSYFSARPYRNYRITFTEKYTDTIYLHEMQPLVCSLVVPQTITFSQTAYSSIVNFQSVNIRPILREFSQCTISPTQLPAGVSLNVATCVISGTPTSEQAVTTYTMTSTMGGNTYSGSFSLATPVCAGSMMELLKIYMYNAVNEGFTIKDAATNTVILSVAPNSGQSNVEEVSTKLCITSPRISISVTSEYSFWNAGSMLLIKSYLSPTEKETLLRARYDSVLGLPTMYYVNAVYAVPPISQWYYKMSEVPTDWYNSVTTGWTEAATGSFPEPSNRIQLYKKTFTIASLANVAGYTVTMKYQYGCVIYMNGVEVFRNGVAAGPVTTTSEVNNFYNDITFHTVSLPARTMTIGTTTGAATLIQGSNTIAIALVAMSDTQKTVVFDAAVNLMGENEVSRVFDYTITSEGSGFYSMAAFDHFHGVDYQGGCENNAVTISFNEERREWISSILIENNYKDINSNPTKFTVEARNSNTDEWHQFKAVTGLVWSLVGQKKKIWILNNTPYKMYRFSNFGTGSTTNCEWKVNRIDLYSDNLSVDIPALSYTSPPVFKGIEMAEAYPSSEYYTNFSISPSLPTGLGIDPQVGVISGTAPESTGSVTYTITATKATGGAEITTTVSFAVQICTGGKSLITVVLRTDNFPSDLSYKVFRGRGNTGEMILQSGLAPEANTFHYIDQCLNNGLYTFEATDSLGDGWLFPAGYTMSVDVGAMYFDMNMVPEGKTSSSTVFTVFSSYMPFQVEYDTWRLYKLVDAVSDTWMQKDFDDTTWTLTLGKNFAVSESVTVYARRSFDIPNLDDYSVLNVRMKYTGGVVVYFNGKKVARFNLEEDFSAESSGIIAHDATSASKFHIILITAGAVTTNNVIAVEIHRPTGASSSTPIVFDASGIFGVAECSPVLDTYSEITFSSAPTDGSVNNLFDLFPYNTCTLANEVNSNIQWSVENLEGSKFNKFGIFTKLDVTGWGFTLAGRSQMEDDWMTVNEESNQTTKNRELMSYDAAVAIAGYITYKWTIKTAASAANPISSMIFSYCKAKGNICPGIGDYPPVQEGQISPSVCSTGYRGYSFRLCTGGTLGEIDTTRCVPKKPVNLHYLMSKYSLVKDVMWTSGIPEFDNFITVFKLDNGVLPTGITLNPTTGELSGKPTSVMELSPVTIFGENAKGAVSVTLSFVVRLGECKTDGSFASTNVGVTAVYQCSAQGSYVGSQKRACVLGLKDGEWQQATGFCVSTFVIIILIVVVVVVIAVVVFIVVRMSKKTKATGGVKGKKSKVSTIKASKKSVKSVKV